MFIRFAVLYKEQRKQRFGFLTKKHPLGPTEKNPPNISCLPVKLRIQSWSWEIYILSLGKKWHCYTYSSLKYDIFLYSISIASDCRQPSWNYSNWKQCKRKHRRITWKWYCQSKAFQLWVSQRCLQALWNPCELDASRLIFLKNRGTT